MSAEQNPTPGEIPTTEWDTERLYDICGTLLRRHVEYGLADPNILPLVLVSGELPETLDETIERHCYEMPHISPTRAQVRTLSVIMDTEENNPQKISEEYTSLPQIIIEVERTRWLGEEDMPQDQWFPLTSKIEYECTGRGRVLQRNTTELIDDSVKSLRAAKTYAERHDPLLLAGVHPLWENSEFNLQASKDSRFEDFTFDVLPGDIADAMRINEVSTAEFNALIALIKALPRSSPR